MIAVCVIPSCRRRAPATSAFCHVHADRERLPKRLVVASRVRELARRYTEGHHIPRSDQTRWEVVYEAYLAGYAQAARDARRMKEEAS